MWIDEHGVAHTVAVPMPGQLMTKSFRFSLDGLLQTDQSAVEDAIAKAEETLFEAQPAAFEPTIEAQFVGLPPPMKVLRGSIRDAADVLAAIGRVDERWRLDAIPALEDYID